MYNGSYSPCSADILRGDKMSMLIHTHSHKSPRKIKVVIYITRLTTHFTCGMVPDLVICKHIMSIVIITECPY